ncbi:unnamed protein product [marine sediment metagenome]|uniref:Uncharacterized protein n=1 Tax=marine sediment metagenome TaxID=412755 RepID=X1DCR1_9ZZZZ
MELTKEKIAYAKKAQVGNVAVGVAITALIATIMYVAVAIPIVQEITITANVTGTTATILNLLPLFYALGALIAVSGLIGIMSLIQRF